MDDLIQTILKIGKFAEKNASRLIEVDINPLIVRSEGKGVIAEGKLNDKKYFIADKILAKHDENYMPPEVSDALEKSNY